MMTIHETTIQARCPVDEGADHYAVTIETSRMVSVEDIAATIKSVTDKGAQFQEVITVELARRLGARVTTVGFHSGFKTTCCAGLP